MAHQIWHHIGGNMDIFIASVLAVALFIATVTDLKSQRIYNWLTFPLMLSGLVVHTLHGGLDGLALSASGFALGFGVMVVPFFLGLMGAGDVKLMAGVGAWLGLNATLTAFLFTCLAGGVYSIMVLLRHLDYMKQIFNNIWHTLLMAITIHKFEYSPVSEAGGLPRLCYGVAITVGTVGAMVLNFTQTGSILVR